MPHQQVTIRLTHDDGEFLPRQSLQRVDARFKSILAQMLCQCKRIVQASDVQLTGHSLELYQFVISAQFLQALCKSVDQFHAVIGHIREAPHLRHGGVALLQPHLLPAVHLQAIQHGVQLCLLCGQVQLYGTDVADAEEIDHIRRLSWRPAQVGRGLPQLGLLHHIAVGRKYTALTLTHRSADLLVVQHFQYAVRHGCQSRKKIVLHVELSQRGIVRDPRHHMAAIHAVCQIQYPPERQLTAVVLP